MGAASSASANPTNCTVTNGGNFAESQCTGGAGEHRAVMRQRHFNPAVGEIACQGPWVPVGTVSRASCASQTVISVTVETRSSTGSPGMTPQPTSPPMPDPTPRPSLDCRMTSNGAQLFAVPSGLRALRFGFTLEFCYNSAGDLVLVTPSVRQPEIQLPAEEASRGLPVGSVGTVSVSSTIPFLGQITQTDTPVLTSQGQTYNGFLTVNFSFVPRGGARQIYQASVGLIINASGAFPTPLIFVRSA